jgi:cytochrome c
MNRNIEKNRCRSGICSQFAAISFLYIQFFYILLDAKQSFANRLLTNAINVRTMKSSASLKRIYMQRRLTISRFARLATVAAAAAVLSTTVHAAVDADAAVALAKKSDCLKCHAIDKDKKASSYKKIALSWKGKPDAVAKVTEALTKGPKVKMKDGTEEEHKIIESKDPAALKNLVEWILSQ